jgi:hypothetical protein
MSVHEIEVMAGDNGVMWRPLDAEGNYLGRAAVTEVAPLSGVVQVRLYERSGQYFPNLHIFDAPTAGEAGLWATWWCSWEI